MNGRNLLAGCIGLLLVAGGITFSLERQSGPPPLDVSAPGELFSAARAMQQVEVIAARPHPSGTDEHASARDYIAAQLRERGLKVEIQTDTEIKSSDNALEAWTIHNVVARLAGTNNSGAILLAAHYDSVPLGPGAMDDTAAVATLLETARALLSGPALRNDVIFLFTDDEEGPQFGVRSFVNHHPWANDVGLALNFDARGNRGPFIMFETSLANPALIRQFSRAAPRPVANSLTFEIYKRMPNGTDFTILKHAKMAGFNFACIDGSANYHTTLDTPERLSRSSLQHEGSYALSLTRFFGQAGLGQKPAAQDTTYFDLLGFCVVSYPGSWVLVLAALVSLAYLGSAIVLARQRNLRPGSLLLWAGVQWLVIALCFGAGVGLFRVLAPHYGERLLLTLPEWLVGGLAVLGLAAAALLVHVAERRNQRGEFLFAVLGCWLVLMWVAGLRFNGGSYLFLWPLALALCGLPFLRAEKLPAFPRHLLLLCFFVLPTVVLIVPVMAQAVVAMGTRLAGAVLAVAVVTGPLLLVPFAALLPKTWPRILAAGSAVAGLALVVVALAGMKYSRDWPQRDDLKYVLDADASKALWVSADLKTDPWTARALGAHPGKSSQEEYFPGNHGACLTNSAPVYSLEPPQVAVVSDAADDGGRHVVLKISTRRNAPILQFRTRNAVTGVAVNGKAMPSAKQNFPNGLSVQSRGHGTNGLELSLTLGSRDLEFTVGDVSYGLPAEVAKRPEWLVPAVTSDTVTVRTVSHL